MRTRVHVVAVAGADGRTRLATVSADGQLAVRETGPATVSGAARVHLVGAAAGPMGGDEVVVTVDVGPGAALAVRSAAAAIALPGGARDGSTARVRTEISVATGGRLDLACEPTVVCSGAVLATRTEVEAADGADMRIVEQTVLGRHGEHGGDWTGRTSATLAGTPVLRSSLDGDSMRARGGRAVITVLSLGPSAAGAVPAASAGPPWAVLTPLAPGGRVATAWAADLASARTALDHVAGLRSLGHISAP